MPVAARVHLLLWLFPGGAEAIADAEPAQAQAGSVFPKASPCLRRELSCHVGFDSLWSRLLRAHPARALFLPAFSHPFVHPSTHPSCLCVPEHRARLVYGKNPSIRPPTPSSCVCQNTEPALSMVKFCAGSVVLVVSTSPSPSCLSSFPSRPVSNFLPPVDPPTHLSFSPVCVCVPEQRAHVL